MSRGRAGVSVLEEHLQGELYFKMNAEEVEREDQEMEPGGQEMEPTRQDGDPTGQEAELPGLLSRYFRVITSPDALFQGLRSRPDWFGAMLLGSCLVLVGTVLIPPELTLATLRERIAEQGQEFLPGLADRMAAIRFGGAMVAFVFWAVMLAIFSGVVTVFFRFLLGHEGTYRQYLAVVAHAHLISATSGILLAPLRILAEDAQLLLSLGAFASFLEAGFVLRFLSFLDLFGLWSWLLVGLGVARIGGKRSWAGGAVIVMLIPVTMAAVIAIFTG